MRLIEPNQITKMMSDLYISEDAVNMTGERQGLWVRFRAIEKAVSEIPTIDAVEVVRCKDCKHYNFMTKGCKRNPSVEGWEHDDFCSYGEKQVTGKLNNSDDSLLTEYSEGIKEQESKLEPEELQLSPKTSKTSTNGIYIRDGGLINDLVYRGEAEVDIPTNTPTNTPTDLISRQGVIDAIEGTVWYRINKNGEMVSGSTNEHESWYKHDDIMLILKTIPSPPVTHAKRTETHGVCSDCISRQAVFCILENKMIHRPLSSDRWVIRDIGKDIELLPPVEPKPVCEDCIDRYDVLAELDPQSYEYKVVKELPSVEPKSVCDDAISRQAAIRWVKTECNPYGNPTLDFESGKKVIEHLKQMPSAQPEKRTDKRTETHGVCSDCISRQEAIEVIKQYDFSFPQYMERFATELRDAMKEDLLDDIQSLPPVEPKIYGNEHNCIMTMFGECSYSETGCGSCEVVEKVRDALNGERPSVEPKRPKGEWVEVEDYNGDIHYQCNQCGDEFILIDGTPEDNNYWYCPNCGARMTKGGDDE